MRMRWRRHVSFLISLWRWLLVAFFIISVYIVLQLSSERSSADLEKEISRLSVYYVRALAREKRLHAAADVDVADLQRTMSVLLHNMLQQLGRAEGVIQRNTTARLGALATGRGHSPSAFIPVPPSEPQRFARLTGSASAVSAKEEQSLFDAFSKMNRIQAVMSHVKGKCDLPENWRSSFPECEGKLAWMQRYYKSDPCYAKYGVDGSHCSAVVYLSEVETFCPHSTDVIIRRAAQLTADLGPLPVRLAHAPGPVASRVRLTWPLWAAAASRYRAGVKAKTKAVKLRVALVPLGLADTTAEDAALAVMSWADLTAALHALGHDLVWVHSEQRLADLVKHFPSEGKATPCQASVSHFLDLIYADDKGAESLQKALGPNYVSVSCIVRVVRKTGLIPGNERPPNNLMWRQFLTPFPTFDDHTFLGFALKESTNPVSAQHRQFALVLASRVDLFAGMGPYLAAIGEKFALHTLLPSTSERSAVAKLLHPHVQEFTNHRLSFQEVDRLQSLFTSAALVVGLGKPLDPALALLAIAAGAVFLNPVFDQPRLVMRNVSLNVGDWRVTSQHTYLERFIGEPFVVGVPIDRPQDVVPFVRAVSANLHKVKPHVPFEFTYEGYLQRLEFFHRNQDLCSISLTPLEPAWPPASSVEFYLSVKGDSCEKTCFRKERVCEPAYFPVINSRMELQERSIDCATVFFQANPTFPAFSPEKKICYFQSDPQRYSCFHTPGSSKLLRICPCRDHKPGQISLCKDCL